MKDRCVSSVALLWGGTKRCIRATGHHEPHAWIESLAVVGRDPEIYIWEGDADVNAPTFVGRVVPRSQDLGRADG